MYMMKLKSGILAFEWDKGNLDKSYQKHGISPKEAEEVFVSKNSIVLPDVKHSQKEPRYIIVGKTLGGKQLTVVFAMRKERICIISARRMHMKEVAKYEKIKEDSAF